jgi:hypothetical protein
MCRNFQVIILWYRVQLDVGTVYPQEVFLGGDIELTWGDLLGTGLFVCAF